MFDKNANYVVCMGTDELDQASAVEGSVKDSCAECGKGVWLSPKTKETQVEMNAKLICMPCAIGNGADEFVLHERQLAEANEQKRKDIQRN